MKGKIKIVNGNIVKEGDTDIESGTRNNNNNINVNNNDNNNNNTFVNNLSIYHKCAIAFLMCIVLFGMRIAFPLLMTFVLYIVYKSPQTVNNRAGQRHNNSSGGRSNIRTVSDLPKPPPSA